MKKNFSCLCLMAFSSIMPVSADMIAFKNKDSLTGKVHAIKKGIVEFYPSFKEDLLLSLDLETIEAIKTDQPLNAALNNGTILKGTLSYNPQEYFSIQAGDSQAQPITHDNFAEIYSGAPKDKHAWKRSGHIKGGFNATQGNTDTTAINLDGRLVAEKEEDRFTLYAGYNVANENNVTTRDRTYGGAKYDHFVSSKIFTYLNADLERDKFQDLNLRTSLGAGLGYQIYDQDDLHLNIEAGPNFVDEDFSSAGRDNRYLAARWGLNYDQQLTKALSIYHNHKILQSLETSSDTVINARTGFNVPLFETLQAGFEWRLDWLGNPALGRETTDHTYVATLGYFF